MAHLSNYIFFLMKPQWLNRQMPPQAAKVSNLSGRICKYLQLRKNAVSMRMLLDNPAPQTTWDQVATMFRCTLGCHVTRGDMDMDNASQYTLTQGVSQHLTGKDFFLNP